MKKPSVEVFSVDYKSKSLSVPWNDDKYLKTVIDNDPALQFGNLNI